MDKEKIYCKYYSKVFGYILSKMNDTDRKALTDAIYALIAASPAAVETKPAE